MTNRNLYIYTSLAGLASGLIAGYFGFGPWSSIVLWGAVAFIFGLLMKEEKNLWASIPFGVVLTFSFLLSVFGGTADKLPSYLLFTLGMSLGGIVGGLVAMFIGRSVGKYIDKRNENY